MKPRFNPERWPACHGMTCSYTIPDDLRPWVEDTAPTLTSGEHSGWGDCRVAANESRGGQRSVRTPLGDEVARVLGEGSDE
jgi:hypothetical protein